MNRVFALVLYFSFGCLLLVAGLLTPAYWKVVPASLFQGISDENATLQSKITYLLDSEKPGVVTTLFDANTFTNTTNYSQQVDRLLQQKPIFHLSGGAEPYFEKIFSANFTIPQLKETYSGYLNNLNIVTNSSRIFLNKALRLRLLELSNDSSHAAVQSLIKARQIKHFQKLDPLDSPSQGVSLDVAVLQTALLIQSGFFSQSISNDLKDWSEKAIVGPQSRETEKLEIFLLSILNLSTKLGYLSLAELAQNFPSSSSLVQASKVATQYPNYFPTYYAASLILGNPNEISNYIFKSDQGQVGLRIKSLEIALTQGRSALDYLIKHDKYLTSDSALLSIINPTTLKWQKMAGLDNFALNHFTFAFVSRMIFMWGSGLCFVGFFVLLSNFRETKTKGQQSKDTGQGLVMTRNILVALLIGGIFWFSSEPPIAHAQPKQSQQPSATSAESSANTMPMAINANPMNTQTLDQPTIIVLFAFLVIQFILYIICRIKLTEIKKSGENAGLKLELLANEENLFDSGLYVGLGGTVMALSMVTLGMVDASLMAAYASTLFGIISVAFLKIFHLRPMRKQLLIEVGKK